MKDEELIKMIESAKTLKIPAKTLTDLSYYTLEDITAFYNMSAKTKEQTEAYNYLADFLRGRFPNVITLGDVIPKEYIHDPIKMLDSMLIYTHIREQELITKQINEMEERYNKLLEEVEKRKYLNYQQYIKKKREIEKKIKELKKKEKLMKKKMKMKNKKKRGILKYLSWFR